MKDCTLGILVLVTKRPIAYSPTGKTMKLIRNMRNMHRMHNRKSLGNPAKDPRRFETTDNMFR
jgi:hypothetical protein